MRQSGTLVGILVGEHCSSSTPAQQATSCYENCLFQISNLLRQQPLHWVQKNAAQLWLAVILSQNDVSAAALTYMQAISCKMLHSMHTNVTVLVYRRLLDHRFKCYQHVWQA
jgi:hypothetical protein